MFCPKCGAQLPEGLTFCSNCGARLDAQEAPAEEKEIQTPDFQENQNQDPDHWHDEPAAAPGAGYTQPQDPAQGYTAPQDPAYGYGQPQNQGYGQPQAPGYGYDPNAGYMDPGPYNQVSPITMAVKDGVGSVVFLLMTLCLTVSLLVILGYGFSYGNKMNVIFQEVRPFAHYDTAFYVIMFIVMIPSILTVIGTWIMWGSSRGRGYEVKGTGLVKSAMIIYAVCIGLAIVAYAAGMIMQISEYNNARNAYNSFYGGSYYSSSMDSSMTAFIIVSIITLAILIIFMIYYIKIGRAASIIRDSSVTGRQTGDISGLITVINVVVLICQFIVLIAVVAGTTVLNAELKQAEMEVYARYGFTLFQDGMTMTYIFIILSILTMIFFTASISKIKKELLYAQSVNGRGY